MPGPAVPLAAAGISALGNWLASRNQPNNQGNRRVPFTGAVDPSLLLGEGMSGLSGLMASLSARMASPITLPGAYAQSVPGLSGRDPLAPAGGGPNLTPIRGGMDWGPAQAAQAQADDPIAPSRTPRTPSGRGPLRAPVSAVLAQAPAGAFPSSAPQGRAVNRATNGPIRIGFGDAGGQAPRGGGPTLTPQQQAAIRLLGR